MLRTKTIDEVREREKRGGKNLKTITINVKGPGTGLENLEFVKKIIPGAFSSIIEPYEEIRRDMVDYIVHFDYFSEREIERFTSNFSAYEPIKMFDNPKEEKKNLENFLDFAKAWKEKNEEKISIYSMGETPFKKLTKRINMQDSKERKKFLKNTYLKIRRLNRVESLKKLVYSISCHEESFFKKGNIFFDSIHYEAILNGREILTDKSQWRIYLNEQDWKDIQELHIKNNWKMEVRTENFIFPGCYYIVHPVMNLMFIPRDEEKTFFYLRICEEDYIWKIGKPEKFRASDSFYKRNFKHYEKVLFIQKILYNGEFWKLFIPAAGLFLSLLTFLNIRPI